MPRECSIHSSSRYCPLSSPRTNHLAPSLSSPCSLLHWPHLAPWAHQLPKAASRAVLRHSTQSRPIPKLQVTSQCPASGIQKGSWSQSLQVCSHTCRSQAHTYFRVSQDPGSAQGQLTVHRATLGDEWIREALSSLKPWRHPKSSLSLQALHSTPSPSLRVWG